MEELQIKGLGMSRFDSLACVVSKFHGAQNTKIDEEALEKLKGYIQKVIPWSRDVRPASLTRFKIVGIPLHLWNDLTIEKIGSTIGEVKEIHTLKQCFYSAEVSIIFDDTRTLGKSLVLKEGNYKYQINIKEIKDPKGHESCSLYNDISTSYTSSPLPYLTPINTNPSPNEEPSYKEEDDTPIYDLVVVGDTEEELYRDYTNLEAYQRNSDENAIITYNTNTDIGNDETKVNRLLEDTPISEEAGETLTGENATTSHNIIPNTIIQETIHNSSPNTIVQETAKIGVIDRIPQSQEVKVNLSTDGQFLELFSTAWANEFAMIMPMKKIIQFLLKLHIAHLFPL